MKRESGPHFCFLLSALCFSISVICALMIVDFSLQLSGLIYGSLSPFGFCFLLSLFCFFLFSLQPFLRHPSVRAHHKRLRSTLPKIPPPGQGTSAAQKAEQKATGDHGPPTTRPRDYGREKAESQRLKSDLGPRALDFGLRLLDCGQRPAAPRPLPLNPGFNHGWTRIQTRRDGKIGD